MMLYPVLASFTFVFHALIIVAMFRYDNLKSSFQCFNDILVSSGPVWVIVYPALKITSIISNNYPHSGQFQSLDTTFKAVENKTSIHQRLCVIALNESHLL